MEILEFCGIVPRTHKNTTRTHKNTFGSKKKKHKLLNLIRKMDVSYPKFLNINKKKIYMQTLTYFKRSGDFPQMKHLAKF